MRRRDRRGLGAARCGGGPPERASHDRARFPAVGEAHERLAYLDHLARPHVDVLDPAGQRRGNLYLSLVGLHLDERRVRATMSPSATRTLITVLDEALAQVWKHEGAGGHGSDS